MESYTDDLVELANQAWILNVALAELHGFNASVDAAACAALSSDRDSQLVPAINRLQTRLQALMAKWQRRVLEQSPRLESLSLQTEPWGYHVAIPEAVRQQMQRQPAVTMPLVDAKVLAAQQPNALFTFDYRDQQGLTIELDHDATTLVTVSQFSGVDLNVCKMWWSWWDDANALSCRLQAFSDNLWQVDSCDYAVSESG
ncbi:MAG: hypothetical protein V7752_21575 [Halopseudomonas sp.]